MTFFKRSKFRVASLLLLALSSVLTSRFTAVASTSSRGPNGTAEDTNPVRNLYIGAFFSYPKLSYQPVVAQTAIDHINSLQGIVDGYHLEMRWNWTGSFTLNPPRRLKDFSYSDEDMARTILKNAHNLDFTGLLGRVLIKDGQRQTDKVYVEQVHDNKFETVMVYKVQAQEFQKVPGGAVLTWAGKLVEEGCHNSKTTL